MEFNPGIILATIVNFLILFFGLKYFFFEKVKLIVEARENEIVEKLDNADMELEKREILLLVMKENFKGLKKKERLLQKAIRKGLKKYMMKLLKKQELKQI